MDVKNETNNNNIYCLDIAGYEVLDAKTKRKNMLAKYGRKHSLDTIGEKGALYLHNNNNNSNSNNNSNNNKNNNSNNNSNNNMMGHSNGTLVNGCGKKAQPLKEKAVQTFPQKKHSWSSKLWSSIKQKKSKTPSPQEDQVCYGHL